MKCKICGSECPPGARICRDCAAARKRAFAATVTQPLLAGVGVPSVSTPRFAPKPARPRPALAPTVERDKRPEPTPALPLNMVPRALGVHWLLIGLAVATTIVVLLVKILSAGSGHATEDAADIAGAPATAVVASPAPPTTAPAETHLAQNGLTLPRPAEDVHLSTNTPMPHKAAPRPAPTKSVAIPPPPAPEPAPISSAPAPPPRAVEVPRPDPWQAMNDGLLRCAREDLFGRIACEQRLRLQYCPNYWGLVPQCPIGPATDHGQ